MIPLGKFVCVTSLIDRVHIFVPIVYFDYERKRSGIFAIFPNSDDLNWH